MADAPDLAVRDASIPSKTDAAAVPGDAPSSGALAPKSAARRWLVCGAAALLVYCAALGAIGGVLYGVTNVRRRGGVRAAPRQGVRAHGAASRRARASPSPRSPSRTHA